MILSYFAKTFGSLENKINLQFVRYRRKPRWIPTAPSKIFRIPTRPHMKSEEAIEWLRVNQHYKTQINSLRRFLIKEALGKQDSVALDRPSAEDITKELEINKKWNTEIAELREKRVAQIRDERKTQIVASLARKKEYEDSSVRKIKDTVAKIDEQSRTFITRDMIDKSIEYCLTAPKSYEYCIDSKGNIIDSKAEEPNNAK